MKKLIILIVLLVTSGVCFAVAPTCHSNGATNYCKYYGKVSSIYINSGNIILIYFENAIDVSVASSFGFNISHGEAAAFNVSDNPDFAKLFYSTALAAQASGRNVNIQMRDVQNGYLKFDRIWLYQ